MTKQKLVFALIGVVISAALVLAGFLTMGGALGGETGIPGSAPYSYDSGYATFGGDFYTFVNNNAGEAASGARMAASNLDDIAQLLRNTCGIVLMGLGFFGLCHFGMVGTDLMAAVKAESAAAAAEAAAAAPEQDAPAQEPSAPAQEPSAPAQE